MTETNLWDNKCSRCKQYMDFLDDRSIANVDYEYFECYKCHKYAIAKRCLIIEEIGTTDSDIEEGGTAFDAFELYHIKKK